MLVDKHEPSYPLRPATGTSAATKNLRCRTRAREGKKADGGAVPERGTEFMSSGGIIMPKAFAFQTREIAATANSRAMPGAKSVGILCRCRRRSSL